LGNVFVLRTIDDTKQINAAIAAASVQQPEIVEKVEAAVGADKLFKARLVIIGSSFIGMEAALAAAKKASVTVVGMDKVPFESILGPQIGDALRKNHEKQGIQFRLSAELSHFEPSSSDSSKVGSVVLKSGEKLPADVVLMGAGVKPVTDYAQNIPGIQLDDKDKSIIVDEQLRLKGIGKKNVYAIGDIAKFPDVKTGDQMRIEHWNGESLLLVRHM
jgi:NADPH-dependent 2,4-dienoyl-CoA reductase/sulfur reductase-like enzyme